MSNTQPSTICSPRAVSSATELYALWQARLEQSQSPLDRTVSGFFRSHKELNSGERRWISAAIYGTVRLLRRQEAVLKALERETTSETLINLWRDEHEPGADANVTNAIIKLPNTDSPSEHLRTTLSFPDDLASSLEQQLGAEAIAAGEALNCQAPTTIRVNPLRATIHRVRQALPDAVPARYSPWGMELPRRVNIHDLPGFKQGWYEIQEEASQLAALLSDAQPGMIVVDVGAGAGGKTLALAVMMKCTGKLVALDHSEERLEELTERAKRAAAIGIEYCRVRLSPEGGWHPTGTARQELNKLWGRADCVFVDAPCTGSGVIRRSPDAKWRQTNKEEMSGSQLRLLEQSAALAKPGGCVIYVTCAIERYQNEEVVDRFLETEIGKQFTVEPALPALEYAVKRAAKACLGSRSEWAIEPLKTLIDGPYMRTWPHRTGLDAFFGARLRRS